MRTELRNGEKLEIEVRRHWLILLKPVLWTALFVLAGILVLLIPSPIQIAAAGFFIAAIPFAGWLIYRIYDRKFDIWAVTNLRVIDEAGVFSHSAKESPLDKINNVSYQQSFWGRILGYGTVEIQTAAEMGATTYAWLTSPRKLKDTITRCQEEYKRSAIGDQASRLAQALAESQKDEGETRECPYCAEKIKAKAKVCRYCNRTLT
jgi:uncharacterized membrane protein YdbT with pleckstrin-like domain